MLRNITYWQVPFMDFVDEVRRKKNGARLTPLVPDNERFDALIASSLEYLCNESGCTAPDWVYDISACKEPWFVAGVESLKAIAIVESPVWFRRRKIFVLENFLSRV